MSLFTQKSKRWKCTYYRAKKFWFRKQWAGYPLNYWLSVSSVQSLSRVRLFATPWITAHQASLSITNSRSSLRLPSIESVMPSSHLILRHPLLLLPPIPPSISRALSVHGISQARILEWVAISFSRRSSLLRDRTCVSCIGRQVLYHWATREAQLHLYFPLKQKKNILALRRRLYSSTLSIRMKYNWVHPTLLS